MKNTQPAMVIEVFKTNVLLEEDAALIVKAWKTEFPHSVINFDLDDCDRILRVQAHQQVIPYVPELVKQYGFACEPLAD